jgi:tRNA nucleotidyltransferase (CCA-adding enzyme)
MTWEHFAHGADIGVRGVGDTPADAFAEAAVALTAVLADPNSVDPREAVAIRCSALDDEQLFVDWLNALVFEMATRRMLFARFEVRKDDHALVATAWGEPLDLARHRPAVEVKAATYTDLLVRRRDDDRWVAQCVVDV